MKKRKKSEKVRGVRAKKDREIGWGGKGVHARARARV